MVLLFYITIYSVVPMLSSLFFLHVTGVPFSVRFCCYLVSNKLLLQFSPFINGSFQLPAKSFFCVLITSGVVPYYVPLKLSTHQHISPLLENRVNQISQYISLKTLKMTTLNRFSSCIIFRKA